MELHNRKNKDEQSTDDEQVAATVLAAIESETDETEVDRQLSQSRENKSRRSSSSNATRKITRRRQIPIDKERKRTREKLEKGEKEHNKRKKTEEIKNSSNESTRTSTPTANTTTITSNQEKNKISTKRKNEKKKGTNEEEREKKDVAYVSIVAIPKASKKTREVGELYREMVRYAVEAMEGREKRRCSRSSGEKKLLEKWNELNREFSLVEKHGGKLQWEVEEEGRTMKDNNRFLSAKIKDMTTEVEELRRKIVDSEVQMRIEVGVGKQMEEHRNKLDEESKGKLGWLWKENGELRTKIGEMTKELELRQDSVNSLVEMNKKRRRGKKKTNKGEVKRNEQRKEEKEEKDKTVSTEYRVLQGKCVHVVQNIK